LNCCVASTSYTGSSELARHVLSARDFALSDKHLPGQDSVATCAACRLGGRETIEKLDASNQLPSVAYAGILKEAGLDGHIIRPNKPQDISVQVVPGKR
jgi:heterodisulfide reductase subunit B2